VTGSGSPRRERRRRLLLALALGGVLACSEPGGAPAAASDPGPLVASLAPLASRFVLALGAGRIFDQGAKLVSAAIADGRLYRGPVWQKLTEQVRQSGEPLHFIGLLSDGNVHSHIDHLFALIRRCDEEEVERVRVHVLLDGRDVPEKSALGYVDALEELLETLRSRGRDYRVASGGGRMVVTMDRYEADWRIVERGWNAHVHGDARLADRHEPPRRGRNRQLRPSSACACSMRPAHCESSPGSQTSFIVARASASSTPSTSVRYM